MGTHSEFLEKMDVKQIYSRLDASRDLKKVNAFRVVHVDLAHHTEEELAAAQNQVNWVNLKKCKGKNNPSFLIQADKSIHTIKSKDAANFVTLKARVQKSSGTRIIKDFKELVQTLKKNHQKHDDCTVVFCNPELSVDTDLRSKALRLVNFESEHQVLEVTDPELAKLFQMTPGNFYIYYKPSVACGFSLTKFLPLADVETSQALVKNYYRGELKMNEKTLKGM